MTRLLLADAIPLDPDRERKRKRQALQRRTRIGQGGVLERGKRSRGALGVGTVEAKLAALDGGKSGARHMICEACREPFAPQRRWARFCSTACRMAAYRERPRVTHAAPGRGTARALKLLPGTSAGLCDHRDALVVGETGVLLVISLDQRVAKVILDYCQAAFEGSPILKQLIVSRTHDAIELSNGISIEVRPVSFRKLRGPTYVAVICDELAFWYTDSGYANPDTEVLAAVRPGLLTTRGPLILASSAYAKRGELWDTFRKYYGPDGAR